MYEIIDKQTLNSRVKLMKIASSEIAEKARPGQFVILRVHEKGERIPLTIADYDTDEGSVTIIFQEVGKTTSELGSLGKGDKLLDFVGPLGVASRYSESIRNVAVIGGGLGTAIAYPQAKMLHSLGKKVDVICGFRNKGLVILEDAMADVSSHLYVMTDDGSNGHRGFVTDKLKNLIEGGRIYDEVIAIGPLPMMKFVSILTREYGIKTTVSMNPVMIDGTGMCGGCRLTVGGEIRFACVDGPDFDGHLVDYDEAMRRQTMYAEEEHQCRREVLSHV